MKIHGITWPNFGDLPEHHDVWASAFDAIAAAAQDGPGFFPTSPHGEIADVQHAVFGEDADGYTVTSGQSVQHVERGAEDSKTPQGLGNVAPLGQREWGAK